MNEALDVIGKRSVYGKEVGCTKDGDNDFFADAESQAVGDEEPMIFDS